jgi:hypothetical protein
MCSTRENSPAVENEQNNSTFQKAIPQNLENYRPIANLNHLGKIYEKLMILFLQIINMFFGLYMAKMQPQQQYLLLSTRFLKLKRS